MTLASNTILQLLKRWIALSTEKSFYPWNLPIDTANYQDGFPATYLLHTDLWLVDIELSSVWTTGPDQYYPARYKV